MFPLRTTFLFLLAALATHVAFAEPLQLVLQNGRGIPVSALSLTGDKFVVKTAIEGFNAGYSFQPAMVDHVYGEKPAEINQAIALILADKAGEARRLLEPIVKEHKITAPFPGNFWVDAARALLVAHAVSGDSSATTALGKEISDATPAQGIDPYVLLGKALMLPVLTTKTEDRVSALTGLTTDNMPADLRAYASYFAGNLFKKENKTTEALDAYLSVPCLYPSGGLILNAAAEIQAADLLAGLKRREEALALAQSALHASKGTVLAAEAELRLTSLK